MGTERPEAFSGDAETRLTDLHCRSCRRAADDATDAAPLRPPPILFLAFTGVQRQGRIPDRFTSV